MTGVQTCALPIYLLEPVRVEQGRLLEQHVDEPILRVEAQGRDGSQQDVGNIFVQ